MTSKAGHCIRHERLHVEDSILLLKTTLCQSREETESGTRGYMLRTIFCCLRKIHCGKAGRTLHERREVIGLGQYFAIKDNLLCLDRQDTASVARRSTQHNPTPTAAVADPSQGNQKRTNYKDKQSICTAGTFRLTCTHAMANQALLCQPYPFRNQIKSLRPHHDINPKGHPSGTTRTHKYLNV